MTLLKDLQEVSNAIDDLDENQVHHAELSPIDKDKIIESVGELKKYKRLIIGGFILLKRITGDKGDRIIDKIINVFEMIL